MLSFCASSVEPGWRPGWGWRAGWGWGAAAVGLAASSYYPYGYYPYDYGLGYRGYRGCVLHPRMVLTNWGYRQILVQVAISGTRP